MDGVKQTLFITGTDTGAGKTVLTGLLARFLRGRGVNAAALKPLCSGGRDDARTIFRAMNTGNRAGLSLDDVNPWYFRAAIAPRLAARREHKSVRLPGVLGYLRRMQQRFDVLLVEGAGGLLSPLGEDFDSRDLIRALRATPVIVAPNKLGAINHLLLTLDALPKTARDRTKIVFMSPPKPDAAAASNMTLLAEFFDRRRIFSLPWFGRAFDPARVLKHTGVRQTLRALAP